MRVKQKLFLIFTAISTAMLLLVPLQAIAQQSSSSHYEVNEVQFGSGGNVNGSSTNYKAQTNVGGLTAGNTASPNYNAHTGFLTQNEPFLAVGVISGSVDLGNLTSTATGYASGSFFVQAYTASGYSVFTMGTPPVDNSGGVILKAKTVLGAPIVGKEEFGMNLVKNTNFCGVGCNLGSDPVPVPDNTFANGVAAAGYNTANQFKYGQGDAIASAPKGNGQTNFTESFIADITGSTAAGTYTMKQDIVVVASY